MTAFVLGNGVSRQSIEVDLLIKLGTVYGCNALYRTHTPQVLVATDLPIATAIQESGYAHNNIFYTRKPLPGSGACRVPDRYRGSSSGPIALALAALDGHDRVYMLGFDMGPIAGRFNNVYAGTDFYKNPSADPTYTGNWQRQICQVAEDFPGMEIIRVAGDTTADVDVFNRMANIKSLPINEFVDRINNKKDL